ncbi:hypothetical protein F383_37428 [Gossypium arboreum]|uniref:Uncharacterized protein n=1 Tax=Gossypium arboreum TaxID=29729 RepID=A0A0B0MC89_GOSAR|nr:hypothetical protein F383_37428 [Gossypium arboreum]
MGLLTQADSQDVTTRLLTQADRYSQHMPGYPATGRTYKTSTRIHIVTIVPSDMSLVS